MKFTITNLNIKHESYYSRKGEPYKHSNKLYLWTEGESILENLVNRRNRPVDFYKKEIIPLVMKQIEEQYPEEAKHISKDNWGWRAKCGCSMCPCSPGFVGNSGQYAISVSIKFEE